VEFSRRFLDDAESWGENHSLTHSNPHCFGIFAWTGRGARR